MLDQHKQIRDRARSIEPVRKRWVQTAAAEDRAVLARGYEDVKSVVTEHLHREVDEVMPALDRIMTVEELKTLVQQGLGGTTRRSSSPTSEWFWPRTRPKGNIP